MKLGSQVWMKLESKGKPNDTKVIHATVRESVMHIAGWLNEIYMGSKIVITLARTEAELHESKKGAAISDMMAELDGILVDRPDLQMNGEDSDGHS